MLQYVRTQFLSFHAVLWSIPLYPDSWKRQVSGVDKPWIQTWRLLHIFSKYFTVFLEIQAFQNSSFWTFGNIRDLCSRKLFCCFLGWLHFSFCFFHFLSGEWDPVHLVFHFQSNCGYAVGFRNTIPCYDGLMVICLDGWMLGWFDW